MSDLSKDNFDLIVIGSGPAGQKGAIAASKLGKKVAVIDQKYMIGGVSLHRGTIPSKTLREVIVYLSGIRQRSFYGKDYSIKENISGEDLDARIKIVEKREMAVVNDQLKRNGIQLFYGMARFIDQYTVEVDADDGDFQLKADHFLIACGTRPADNPKIHFDGEKIINVDQILNLKVMPSRMIIIGAGVIGLEYASMFSAMDVEVTLIEQRPEMLTFVDDEIIDRLSYHLRNQNTIFRLNETLKNVTKNAAGTVVAELESGKTVKAETFVYAVGRQANSDLLNLDALGLDVDERGRIGVNDQFQTKLSHIYAAGDVIGFPALAATSMEQGRMAACNMFGVPKSYKPELLPYGIYTIPEISMIGKTEKELTAAKIPYEIGISRFVELARGAIMGLEIGMLKLLFDPKTLKLHGVHIIGETATELIHIGQAVISFGGTIEYFRDTVFNYPTLAEAYKVAALDGLNKL
ncbi:Si-specific NAD(P)(+) transhydrogenase [Roseimarinus sediminis]|uniref:Si-specific NAD(P)(+) transhydrogenase n=1 Tax=Roseimarinus sediminis TaxID=1610899 RepID=UPI003D2000A8